MRFNQYDHLYLGYNKLREVIDPFKFRETAREVEIDFKASAEGGISAMGPSVKSGAESNGRIKHTSLPGIDSTQRTQLLSVAGETLAPIEDCAEVATSSTAYQAASKYSYTGPCRFRVVTHDDWRSITEAQQAPALALWLIELINHVDSTDHNSDLDTVTWILLSGTPGGQLTTAETLDITTSRAGSQTEHLFEELFCQEFGARRSSGDDRWLRGHWRGTSVRNMLNQSSQSLEVEALFRCHGVHEFDLEGEDVVPSYLGWSDASTGKEALVTRLVIGSPYYVQRAPRVEQEEKPRGLSRLWRNLFGFFFRRA